VKVSVVIPSLYHVDGDYLKLCVESLRATVDWDIIVVTNGTPQKPVLSHIKGITQHLHTRDQGQCVAVNIGAQKVAEDTDYIMVSNSDMYYAPDWNRNLRFSHLCLSPNLVEPTDNPGSAPPFEKFDGGFTLDGFRPDEINKYVQGQVYSWDASWDLNTVGETIRETTGFNLPFFIRKDVWHTIGGYDEAYDPWGSNSDTDLQTKIELAGVQPMRLRDVLVYHFSNKSGTFDGTHQAEWQRNWDYYTKKWGFNRDDDPKPDTWMALNLVNHEKNRYHPQWEGKYRPSDA
jgi:glycosyltransferase involved in cell wall biosynthesis